MDEAQNVVPAQADDKLKQTTPEFGDKASDPPELEKLNSEIQKHSEAAIPSTVRTSLLPPFLAVHSVWARTSAFDKQGSAAGILNEASINQLKDQAIKAEGLESQYFFRAMMLMDSSLRNLEIIYKGRELNFEENGQLRTAYLDVVANNVTFGQSANDVVKSLPTMAFTGAAGSLVVSETFDFLTNFQVAMVIMGFAAVGFLLNLIWVRFTQDKKLKNYIEQDYERSIYYEDYLQRTKDVLLNLYQDLNSLHRIVFSQPYATIEEENAELKGIANLINGVEPHLCPKFHKHVAQGITSYSLWPRCETGLMYEECPNRDA